MTASRSVSETGPRRRRMRLGGLAGALAAALILLLAGDGPRWILFDAWQRLAPRDLSQPKVHVVAIDDESLRSLGPWPWPRYHLARLTEEIGRRGATAIAFDMIFPDRDALSPDLFAGMYADQLGAADRARLAALPSFDNVFSQVIGNHPVVVARIGVDHDGVDPAELATEAVIQGPMPAGAATFRQASINIPEIDDAARGYGLVNGPPDADGVIRRVPLIARLGRNPAPSLGLEAVRVALTEENLLLDGGGVRVGARRVPMDPEGRLLLRFGNLPPAATTSAVDLIRRGMRDNPIAGKVVLIGLTARGTPDIVSTPIAAEAFGVDIQAQAIDAMLGGQGWLVRPGWATAAEWSAAVLLAALAVLLLPLSHRAWLAVPIVGLGLIGLTWGMFEFGALLIDPLPSLALGGGAAAGAGLGLFANTRRERERLREALVEERVAAAATEAELEGARSIQLGMLPPRAALSSLDPRLELDAILEPARSVGGDYYDAVRLSADRIAISVADVTGKGVPASLFMAVSKALSKSVVLREGGLGGIAAMLNEELSRDNADSGVTMLLGVIDLSTGQVDLVNAGHEDPILLRGDGSAEDVRMDGGPPFCIVDYPWPVETVTLRPGEALVLLTDGVTEAQDPDGALYGRSRANLAVSGRSGASATEIVEGLRQSVRDFERGTHASDDLTILALRFAG